MTVSDACLVAEEDMPKSSSLLVFTGLQYGTFFQKLVQFFFVSWLTTDLLEFQESEVGIAIILHSGS